MYIHPYHAEVGVGLAGASIPSIDLGGRRGRGRVVIHPQLFCTGSCYFGRMGRSMLYLALGVARVVTVLVCECTVGVIGSVRATFAPMGTYMA
jgi:hypothetical protein